MPPRKKAGFALMATPRRSARTNAAVTKGPYFEHPSEDEDVGHDDESDTASDFQGESEPDDAAPQDEVEADEEEDNGEKEEIPAKSTKKRGRASSATTSQRTDVKKKKASSGEVFVPHKREPSPGDVDYVDDQIHPNTLRFLSGDLIPSPKRRPADQFMCTYAIDLAENNNRSWLHGTWSSAFQSSVPVIRCRALASLLLEPRSPMLFYRRTSGPWPQRHGGDVYGVLHALSRCPSHHGSGS